jgi:beta-fructofuranosidase
VRGHGARAGFPAWGFHLAAPSNWMNDPNGLIYWRGRFHLFYQHNPDDMTPPGAGGLMRWGHAVSEDLVHWRDLPIALAPTPGGPDEDGCYSGCAVIKDGIPHLLYTGVRGTRERPCLARAVDLELLTVWEKHPRNPVIAAPPAGLSLLGFRDHCVWQDDGSYYQLIGSGIAGGGGAVLLYRSPDLENWEYLHPLLTSSAAGPDPTGAMWECPDFFRLGGHDVLVVSALHGEGSGGVFYFVGRCAEGRFKPERQGRLDYGDPFYAPQSMLAGGGRRLMWGWIREPIEAGEPAIPSRVGLMSVPRDLSLSDQMTLVSQPAPELAMLRSKRHWRLGPSSLEEGTPTSAVEPGVKALEVVAVFETNGAEAVGLRLRLDGTNPPLTVLADTADGRLLMVQGARRYESSPLMFHNGKPETSTLHLLIDHGVVEAFGDFGSITELLRAPSSTVASIEAFARGRPATLRQLDVWALSSIWEAGRAD